jgi:hypothetical protein
VPAETRSILAALSFTGWADATPVMAIERAAVMINFLMKSPIDWQFYRLAMFGKNYTLSNIIKDKLFSQLNGLPVAAQPQLLVVHLIDTTARPFQRHSRPFSRRWRSTIFV